MKNTYWQAKDTSGKVFIFTEKPYRSNGIECRAKRGSASSSFLFPIDLKPLQIAEITVNENGTWSYEIEREEGVYMAKNIAGDCFFAIYEHGGWRQKNTGNKLKADDGHTFSSVRIPDECII